MNQARGNVSNEAMAAAMASNIEEDSNADAASSADTDPSFHKYPNPNVMASGGGSFSDASSEAGSEGVVSVAPSSAVNVKGGRRAPRQTAHEMAAEKSDLLYKIDRLKKRGITTHRTVTFDDDIETIRAEYERMNKNLNVDKSIKFQRSLLISFASGAEYLNSTFDPVGIKLDGWSDNVSENIDSYDDVLEELAEKYGSGSSKLPPEIKLLFAIMTSGAMFHLQATMFKSAGIDEVMKENPELAKDVAAAMAKSAEKKSKQENNPAMGSMAGMMGKMFQPGTSRPMQRPDTSDVDQLLADQEELFSESDASEADSVLDGLEEESRRMIIDI